MNMACTASVATSRRRSRAITARGSGHRMYHASSHVLVTEVASSALPGSGQFVLDSARHVVLADNPTAHLMEVSTRPRWIDTQSDGVTIQNFTFLHAANAAQTGAIGNQNRNTWTLTNSQLYNAHGAIVSIGGASNVKSAGKLTPLR